MECHLDNVLLIIFDTLRADYLSCINSDAEKETPNLDSFAEDSVLFKQAFATAPESASSHATMFTGLYPSNHGVACDTPQPPLRDDVPTVAEWLGKHGFDTYAIPGPAKAGSDYGYDRGFDEFVEFYDELELLFTFDGLKECILDPRIGRHTLRAITNGPDNYGRLKFEYALDAMSDELDQPFFLMMNLTGCHSPYRAPRPFMEEATSKLSRSKYQFIEKIRQELGQGVGRFDDSDVDLEKIWNFSDSIDRYLADSNWLNKNEIEIWKRWYTAELAYLDEQFGWFIEEFKKLDVADDTAIIFTADHGELLGEHGLVYHNNFLFDELLHVPLIVSGKGIRSEVRNDLCSLVDLFPTICDLTDVESPSLLDGESIFDSDERSYVFGEIGERDISLNYNKEYMSPERKEYFDAGKKCIRDHKTKYIYYSNGERELYDLSEGETLIDEENPAEYHKELLSTLGEEFQRPSEESVELKESTISHLQNLGYR
ncbi:sulfatase [Haloferax chudinovii]|uniref:Sulfatase n=1 Tax=Haloferax chudinovii TaxID=1109010 RepID=A0ABD5XE20_9EURY